MWINSNFELKGFVIFLPMKFLLHWQTIGELLFKRRIRLAYLLESYLDCVMDIKEDNEKKLTFILVNDE